MTTETLKLRQSFNGHIVGFKGKNVLVIMEDKTKPDMPDEQWEVHRSWFPNKWLQIGLGAVFNMKIYEDESVVYEFFMSKLEFRKVARA